MSDVAGPWIGCLAFWYRAFLMPERLRYAKPGTLVPERSRYFLARLNGNPSSVGFKVALRTVARHTDLFREDMWSVPEARELYLRIAELRLDGTASGLHWDTHEGPSPMRRLAFAVMLDAQEKGADLVRVALSDGKAVLVFGRFGCNWNQLMSIPMALEQDLRSQLLRSASLGCDPSRRLAAQTERHPSWRRIEETVDGTIEIELEAPTA